MLSERDIELAHSEAFDFVFDNMFPAGRARFDRHLAGCRYCQSVVEEYGEIGRVIKSLPPHVEPSAGLEDRTVAAMVAALAGPGGQTGRRSDAEDRDADDRDAGDGYAGDRYAEDRVATRLRPVPVGPLAPAGPLVPAGPPAPAGTQDQPEVARLPAWRRYRGRLVAVAAAAAVIIAAIVVPLSLGGSRTAAAQAAVVIPLQATAAAKVSGYGAATGRATAHQDASGSWDITLTVSGLKNLGDSRWYECWYVSPQHRLAGSAGSFLVPDSGSGTFSMTSAVNPRDFPTMEITIGPPNRNGALAGTVILSGQAVTSST